MEAEVGIGIGQEHGVLGRPRHARVTDLLVVGAFSIEIAAAAIGVEDH